MHRNTHLTRQDVSSKNSKTKKLTVKQKIKKLAPQISKTPSDADKKVICEFCNKSFLKKRFYLSHRVQAHQFESYPCIGCQERFSLARDLAGHMKHVHKFNLSDTTCSQCKKNFPTYSRLIIHNHKEHLMNVVTVTTPISKQKEVHQSSNKKSGVKSSKNN